MTMGIGRPCHEGEINCMRPQGDERGGDVGAWRPGLTRRRVQRPLWPSKAGEEALAQYVWKRGMLRERLASTSHVERTDSGRPRPRRGGPR